MRGNRPVVALLLMNLVLFSFQLAHAASDRQEPVAPVLRGRALELVDDRGHVRAELRIFPADPKVRMPDGTTGYPETVQLRLISSKGAPHVKLATMEDGSALVIGGERGYVQLLARGTNPLVRLMDGADKERVITP